MPDFSVLPLPIISFLVAYGDSLFPTNFFIPGEPVFLLAGFELGSGNGWQLVFLVLLGGILGDQTSYLIGRLLGPKMFNRIKHPKHRKMLARGRLLIKTNGAKFIFAARFLGPVGWVAQAMAGAYRLSYYRYLPASAASAILAISQFIFLGYLSAIGFEFFGMSDIWGNIKLFINQNIILSLLILVMFFVFLWFVQKYIRKFFTNNVK